jgi:hypothetical protein
LRRIGRLTGVKISCWRRIQARHHAIRGLLIVKSRLNWDETRDTIECYGSFSCLVDFEVPLPRDGLVDGPVREEHDDDDDAFANLEAADYKLDVEEAEETQVDQLDEYRDMSERAKFRRDILMRIFGGTDQDGTMIKGHEGPEVKDEAAG